MNTFTPLKKWYFWAIVILMTLKNGYFAIQEGVYPFVLGMFFAYFFVVWCISIIIMYSMGKTSSHQKQS